MRKLIASFLAVTTLLHTITTSGKSDPDLNRNAKNYRDNHIHKDAAEIILHFINGKY